VASPEIGVAVIRCRSTSLANFEVVSIHKIGRGGVVKESEPHEMYSNVLMQSHGSHRHMMLNWKRNCSAKRRFEVLKSWMVKMIKGPVAFGTLKSLYITLVFKLELSSFWFFWNFVNFFGFSVFLYFLCIFWNFAIFSNRLLHWILWHFVFLKNHSAKVRLRIRISESLDLLRKPLKHACLLLLESNSYFSI